MSSVLFESSPESAWDLVRVAGGPRRRPCGRHDCHNPADAWVVDYNNTESPSEPSVFYLQNVSELRRTLTRGLFRQLPLAFISS